MKDNNHYLYRVYDNIICDYVGMPFVANNDAHAKRMLSDALDKSEYAKHASDYMLRRFPLPVKSDDVCRLDEILHYEVIA